MVTTRYFFCFVLIGAKSCILIIFSKYVHNQNRQKVNFKGLFRKYALHSELDLHSSTYVSCYSSNKYVYVSVYLSFVSLSNSITYSYTTRKGNLTQSRWRLSNGSSPAEGRLEYKSEDGDWACICSSWSYFSRYHGDKICQELGFKQMLSYYRFSSTFLFGGCFGEVYKIVAYDEGFSAIPYEGLYNCNPQFTIGLHCSNSE